MLFMIEHEATIYKQSTNYYPCYMHVYENEMQCIHFYHGTIHIINKQPCNHQQLAVYKNELCHVITFPFFFHFHSITFFL